MAMTLLLLHGGHIVGQLFIFLMALGVVLLALVACSVVHLCGWGGAHFRAVLHAVMLVLGILEVLLWLVLMWWLFFS